MLLISLTQVCKWQLNCCSQRAICKVHIPEYANWYSASHAKEQTVSPGCHWANLAMLHCCHALGRLCCVKAALCVKGNGTVAEVWRRIRTRGNGLKLHQGTFRLDIKDNFSSERAVMNWHRLPRKVVGSPSLDLFRAVGMWHWVMWALGMVGLGWGWAWGHERSFPAWTILQCYELLAWQRNREAGWVFCLVCSFEMGTMPWQWCAQASTEEPSCVITCYLYTGKENIIIIPPSQEGKELFFLVSKYLFIHQLHQFHPHRSFVFFHLRLFKVINRISMRQLAYFITFCNQGLALNCSVSSSSQFSYFAWSGYKEPH